MTPTNQQQAFVDTLLGTTGNIALVARAGTGKTSTILLGVAAYHVQFPKHEVMVCAFNKAIADEVKDKIKVAGYDWRSVQASTIHGMGYGLLKFVFKPEIENRKVRNLIRARNEEVFTVYGGQIEALVRYAKGAGVGFFDDAPIGDNAVWHRLADHFDVNGLEETDQMDAIVEAAQSIYRASLAQTDVIDFDDMILFPLIKNLRVKFGKDLIILDEAQDLSRTRQALAKKFLRPRTGRMVVVGDDRQAIYGFSGADADALTTLIDSLQCQVLPLTMTWRCPLSVVAAAQRYVPDIVAADGAKAGCVANAVTLPEKLEATDAILCRNTAPLIEIAYSLIRRGVACKVEGRNIGDSLIELAQRWKLTTVAALLKRLEEYRARETQKWIAKDKPQKVEEINDRCDTLVTICNACLAQKKKNVDDVVAFIEGLFGENVQGVLTLATYHRSKGREWNNVYLWEHATRCPSRAARQDWQLKQEDNLCYVAITRAKQTLTFVGG